SSIDWGDSTVTAGDSGSHAYTAAGDYDVTLETSDGLATATSIKHITVRASDGAPVTVDDVLDAPDGEARSLFVLANDSDPDSDPLVATDATQPSHGSVRCDSGGCTYRPARDYNGADSFTARVSDGRLKSAPATVAVSVTAVNDAPVARPDVISTPRNTPA